MGDRKPTQPQAAPGGLLGQVLEVAAALPVFVTSPLFRGWHLHWGSTPEEASAPMPGDELVPVSHFTATRAISIDAPPAAVWPWVVQCGFGRAGFYSYDLLDNLGRPSAHEVLPQYQDLAIGALAAPMTNPPRRETSFLVEDFAVGQFLVWAKPDSTWAWVLIGADDGRTRLVTRLRQRYRLHPNALVTVLLSEFGDFAMMRKMLRGIKTRAEALGVGSSTENPETGRN